MGKHCCRVTVIASRFELSFAGSQLAAGYVTARYAVRY